MKLPLTLLCVTSKDYAGDGRTLLKSIDFQKGGLLGPSFLVP